MISAISYKGGVGKTTSAVNISSYLQMQGKRVCTVDLDPQH
ncbi:MAG: ParA family protein, partial [[Clostridium] leptum]